MNRPTVVLGERFERALVLAARWHRLQARKSTHTPYVGHLLAVCEMVMREGGDEDECIAALLHDAVEDQGGAARLDDILREFGSRVASIVDEVTEPGTPDAGPRKPPWEERKRGYLDRLATASPAAVLVSISDKTYNLTNMIEDLEEHGDAAWGIFTGGAARQVWFYRSLATIYDERIPGPLSARFRQLVDRLAAHVPRAWPATGAATAPPAEDAPVRR